MLGEHKILKKNTQITGIFQYFLITDIARDLHGFYEKRKLYLYQKNRPVFFRPRIDIRGQKNTGIFQYFSDHGYNRDHGYSS